MQRAKRRTSSPPRSAAGIARAREPKPQPVQPKPVPAAPEHLPALPGEVLALILAAFDGDFKALARAAAVSHTWREAAQCAAAVRLRVPCMPGAFGSLEHWPMGQHIALFRSEGTPPDDRHLPEDSPMRAPVDSVIQTLEPLAKVTGLVSFTADWMFRLWDVEDLTHSAATLRKLAINHCPKDVDWTPLSQLTLLTSLELSQTYSVTSLEPFTALVQLQSLTVAADSGLEGLDHVTALTNLTQLDCSSGRCISTLEPLSSLAALQKLSIDECYRVQSLAPLAQLRLLTSIKAKRCVGLFDLAGVPPNLLHLDCRDCTRLGSLAGVGAASGSLQTLDLSGCKDVRCLAPLAHAVALQTLTLDSCAGVSSLEHLQGLGSLAHLSLRSCHDIRCLKPLSELSKLSTLDVSACHRISTLQPLAGLRKLDWLNIKGCYVIQNTSALDLKQMTIVSGGPWGNPFKVLQAAR